MKSSLLLIAGVAVCAGQPLGLRFSAFGGLPITDVLKTYDGGGRFGGFTARSVTRRYVVGGELSRDSPSRFAFSAGVLYRRFGYDYDSWSSVPLGPILSFTHYRGTGSSWELPLLASWRPLHRRSAAPFVSAGITLRHLAGMEETRTEYDNFTLTPRTVNEISSDRPLLLEHRNAVAPTAGAGILLRAGPLRIAPELRYTRWLGDTLGGFAQPLRWNWQRLDVLIAIGF